MTRTHLQCMVVAALLSACSARTRPIQGELDCRGWVNTFHNSANVACRSDGDCFEGQTCEQAEGCVADCTSSADCASQNRDVCPECEWLLGAEDRFYPRCPPPGGIPELLSGQLDPSDRTLSLEEYYEEYYRMYEVGDQVTLDMRSNEFDTWIQINYPAGVTDSMGRMSASNNDASTSTTNSLLTITVPATGMYQIWATSLRGGEVGAYTLTITVQ